MFFSVNLYIDSIKKAVDDFVKRIVLSPFLNKISNQNLVKLSIFAG